MRLASIRIIVRDIKAVVGFYEKVTEQKAEWLAPVFGVEQAVVSPAAISWSPPEVSPNIR